MQPNSALAEKRTSPRSGVVTSRLTVCRWRREGLADMPAFLLKNPLASVLGALLLLAVIACGCECSARQAKLVGWFD